jgi:replicative DNA helicase
LGALAADVRWLRKTGSADMISTLEYLMKQAANCRRLAKHVLDHDLERRLLGLAEKFERQAEEISQYQGEENVH